MITQCDNIRGRIQEARVRAAHQRRRVLRQAKASVSLRFSPIYLRAQVSEGDWIAYVQRHLF